MSAPSSRPTPARPVLQRPLASYYLVAVSTGLLLAIGFIMVLSASSVRAYSTYGNAYAIAVKQGIFIVIGLPAMWLASRMKASAWQRLGTPTLVVAVGLLFLVLVPGVGHRASGATRWIPLPGGFNLQPSELAKLGICLWGADLLVRKRKLLGDWKHLMVPLVPVVGLIAALVMLQPDMGTTIVVVSIMMSLLWVVGAPMRLFVGLVGSAAALGTLLTVTEPYRLQRVLSFVNPCSAGSRLDQGFQACQGLQALGAGGWLGLGLGASREKWTGGLPNPYTDYVYAIVGEELGLLGTLTVLVLFAVLTYAGLRIAKRTRDPFSRLAASGITIWIAAQALVNMGTVVGMVPITGIPLPLVSFGGSALIPTLIGLGVLLSFARAEPGAAAALESQQGRLRGLVGRGAPARVPTQRVHRPTTAPARRPVARHR